MDRRKFLVTGGTGLGIALAGCSGNDDDNGGDGGNGNGDGGNGDGGSGNGTEADWPPARGIVDVISPSEPGDTRYVLPSLWASPMANAYPGDIDVTVTPTPGAGGILAANQAWDANTDGGTLLMHALVPMVISQMTEDAARYQTDDFVTLSFLQQKARGIQVSQHSTDVEDHWDWDWDTFVNKVLDENLRFGATALTQFLLRNFIEHYEPRLEPGDIEMVGFDGGGDARAAIQRGQLDGYFGGFGPNYPRDDFYKTMFVFTDDRYSDHVENVRSVDENAVVIGDTTFPDDGVENTVDATMDAECFHLPPGTSDGIIEIHEDAVREAGQSETLQQDIQSSLGALELNFSQVVGQEARDFAASKVQTLEDNEDLIPTEF